METILWLLIALGLGIMAWGFLRQRKERADAQRNAQSDSGGDQA